MKSVSKSVSSMMRAQVDMSGLLRLLANNLYSSPEIVIRELVQNAHDSCVRRQLEDPATFEPRITVEADPTSGTLAIEDTGAGLTREEIDRFLATVGAGYTGELRRAGKGDALIGQFGIGFLSAYAVSDSVALTTTSHRTPESSWLFQSTGGERYTVSPAEPRPVGTRVVLRLAQRNLPLSDPGRVGRLVQHYCCLLKVPVFLANASDAATLTPPWRETDQSPLRRRKLSLELASRFEPDFQPLCTFDVGPSDGGTARGLLWVQDGASYATSDLRNVSVFVRGMLVSSRVKELLPPWAGFVGGVLEADALSPTASREDVQRDAAFAATAAQVRSSLIGGLERLARGEPETWRRLLDRHNESLLGAALCEPELFAAMADVLKVPTTAGDLTVPAIRRRSQGKVYATTGARGGAEEVLFQALGVPVVKGDRYAALPFVARHREGTSDLVRLGAGGGEAALFPAASLDAGAAARLDALLGGPGLQVVPARFAPSSLPLVLVPDRDAELKARVESDEADRRIGAATLRLARAFTASIDGGTKARLYVNATSPLVQRLLAASEARAADLARLLRAVGALMAGAEAHPAELGIGAALDQLTAAVEALLAAGERQT